MDRHHTAGQTYSRPVITTDIAATTYAAAQLTGSESNVLDGTNLLPYILREETGDPHKSLFWRQGAKSALRQGDWKVVRQHSKWELYDLSHDISEQHDLADSNRLLLDSLVGEWETINAQMVDAVFR